MQVYQQNVNGVLTPCLLGFLQYRKLNNEGAADSELALHLDGSVMKIYQMLHDR